MNGRRIIATALLAAAACAPAAPALAATAAPAPHVRAACQESQQALTIVAGLGRLTQMMNETQNPAGQINATSAILFVIGQGPVPAVVAGLSTTVSTAQQAVDQFSQLKSLSSTCDQDAVVDAYRIYTLVSQQTLSILTGKAGAFDSAPFATEPIAATLRRVEAVDDALAFSLINLLPDNVASRVRVDAESLGQTIDAALKAYSVA